MNRQKIQMLLLALIAFGVQSLYAESFKKKIKKFSNSMVDTVRTAIGLKKKAIHKNTSTNVSGIKETTPPQSATEALVMQRNALEHLLEKYENLRWPTLIRSMMHGQENSFEGFIVEVVHAFARDHFSESTTSLIDLFYGIRTEKRTTLKIAEKVHALMVSIQAYLDKIDKNLAASIRSEMPAWEQACKRSEEDAALLQRFEETLQDLLCDALRDQDVR